MDFFRTPQIVLFTRDIDRAAAFYRALGFEETFRTPKEGPPIHVDHGLHPVADRQRAAVVLWTDDVFLATRGSSISARHP